MEWLMDIGIVTPDGEECWIHAETPPDRKTLARFLLHEKVLMIAGVTSYGEWPAKLFCAPHRHDIVSRNPLASFRLWSVTGALHRDVSRAYIYGPLVIVRFETVKENRRYQPLEMTDYRKE